MIIFENVQFCPMTSEPDRPEVDPTCWIQKVMVFLMCTGIETFSGTILVA